jgi:hypothetical protein
LLIAARKLAEHLNESEVTKPPITSCRSAPDLDLPPCGHENGT